MRLRKPKGIEVEPEALRGQASAGSEYSPGRDSAAALVLCSPEICETSNEHLRTADKSVRPSRKRAKGKLVVKQALRAASAPVLSEAEGNKIGTEHKEGIISPP